MTYINVKYYTADIGEEMIPINVTIHSADGKGNVVRLHDDFSVRWQDRRVRVPKGFESDGVSCPRILWRLLTPAIHPETLRAGIAHDYIYRGHLLSWTRKEADMMFRDIMVRDGFPAWRANIAYLGVRLFGGFSWRTGER